MATNNNDKTLNVPHLRFPEFSGEWETTSIGEQFELYSGNTPTRINKNQFNGSINWITSGELKGHYISDTKEKISEEAVRNNNLKILPLGTFVIAIYGLEADGVRSTCSITAKESTISQACMAFTSKKDIQNEFLYSWYKKHGNIIGIKYAQGTKQQNLSYDIIEKFNISYPSLEEQEKLIRFISLIEERIATQNKIIEKLESLIRGIYKTLLGESDQYRYLDELCEIKKGVQVNKEKLSEKGLYYVMNGGITPSGYYDLYNTEANTISISEGGNSCGYVQYNYTPFWSGGHCYTLENISNVVDNRYLFHYLKANELQIMSLRIGSGLPNIQKKDLSAFRIPLPALNKQINIAKALDALLYKITVDKNIYSTYKQQKEYLLQQMFI